jgi:hypothetical protein
MINMRDLPLRPAVPPPDLREMFLFGGPLDGTAITAAIPPPGYRDFAGALVVWHLLRIDLMPLWMQRFKLAVEHWRLQQDIERKMRGE